jgi:hypothetical protein
MIGNTGDFRCPSQTLQFAGCSLALTRICIALLGIRKPYQRIAATYRLDSGTLTAVSFWIVAFGLQYSLYS